MVIDTSAIVAIFFDEPDRARFVASLAADRRRLVSAATLVEVQMVFSRTSRDAGFAKVTAFLDRLGSRSLHSIMSKQWPLAMLFAGTARVNIRRA